MNKNENFDRNLESCIHSAKDDGSVLFLKYLRNLVEGVRQHRNYHGDDRCWQDDNMLYQLLPEGYTPPEFDESVALDNCKRYIERRQCPLTKYVHNLVEQAIHDLIARKAVSIDGIKIGGPEWNQLAILDINQLTDLYGIMVHAIVKAGFTVRQVEDRELIRLKERFPDDKAS